MKKISLSKELLLNGVLIGVISIGLASCGGGGGGGSGSTSLSFGGSGPSTPTSPGGSSPSTPLSYSLATPIYADTHQGHFNEPIITVYIDGQPVKLLVATGVSGLEVYSTAVNIPSSDIYSSYTFSGPPGVMASATVCLNPSITTSCVVMPIGVIGYTSSTSTPSNTMEMQGWFGLGSGPYGIDTGHNSSGSRLVGLSYPTYLERQYGINSYTISFYPLSNGYYSDVTGNIPIGQISFGVYNGNSDTLIPYTMNSFGVPSTTVIFSSSTTSFTDNAIFDTGGDYNALNTSVFQTEIPNFSQSSDENACVSYTNYEWPYGIVNSGYVISYSLQTYSGSFYIGSFTTEPSSSFCEANIPYTLMEGVTVDNGPAAYPEIFGLPAMIGHTFTWVLSTSGTNQGFGQYIGISP